jgi:SAM-dependent MidA family methyltransferase
MTPVGEILAAEIGAHGALPFSRFMEAALYTPVHGYYRSARDPFGVAGDFFTASQLQPVFGRLIGAFAARARAALGNPAGFAFVEWGAGRAELAEYLAESGYRAVQYGDDAPGAPFEGVVFSNELFDALPVDVACYRAGRFTEKRVDWRDGSFRWVDGDALSGPWLAYGEALTEHFDARDEVWLELPVRLEETLRRMCAPLTRGSIVSIDYGYTARELRRFPAGTLMSYQRHRALDDVLGEPGLRDITAHVPFTFLCAAAERLGLTAPRLENLSSFLLRVGEPDQFGAALAAPDEAAAARLRLQLKTLLFGLGESFRVLTLEATQI